MNFQEMKKEIDLLLYHMRQGRDIDANLFNCDLLKQVSDALDDMDRMLSAFNYLNKLTIKPEDDKP